MFTKNVFKIFFGFIYAAEVEIYTWPFNIFVEYINMNLGHILLTESIGWFFSFSPNINRTFCKHKLETLVRQRVNMRRLIWVCTFCLSPTKNARHIWVKHRIQMNRLIKFSTFCAFHTLDVQTVHTLISVYILSLLNMTSLKVGGNLWNFGPGFKCTALSDFFCICHFLWPRLKCRIYMYIIMCLYSLHTFTVFGSII